MVREAADARRCSPGGLRVGMCPTETGLKILALAVRVGTSVLLLSWLLELFKRKRLKPKGRRVGLVGCPVAAVDILWPRYVSPSRCRTCFWKHGNKNKVAS